MDGLPEIGEGDVFRRTASVVRQAIAAFGRDGAREWMCAPIGQFDGHTPEEMLSTEKGGRRLEELLAASRGGRVA